MRVEPFNYPLDNYLVKKLDLMIARCIQKNPKKDAVLLNEGAEGEGKTTLSVAEGYYIAWKTGRPFNHTHLFFDVRKMIKFLQETDNQIAIWDEPALQALSKDALTTIVKDLDRLLLMARKKRHFIIINMSYFNKFSGYIVWQRPLGMVHVYSINEIRSGNFVYIKKRKLERLWQDWLKKGMRNYRKWAVKIRGSFPDVLNPEYKNNVLSHFNINYYEGEKDKAIMMIGNDKKKQEKSELDKLKYKLSQAPNKTQMAKWLDVHPKTLYRWGKKEVNDDEKEEIVKENEVRQGVGEHYII